EYDPRNPNLLLPEDKAILDLNSSSVIEKDILWCESCDSVKRNKACRNRLCQDCCIACGFTDPKSDLYCGTHASAARRALKKAQEAESKTKETLSGGVERKRKKKQKLRGLQAKRIRCKETKELQRKEELAAQAEKKKEAEKAKRRRRSRK